MATINTSGNANNICSDTAYQNSIIVKQRFQLFNIPPQRYDNLANNPYIKNPQYTQNDFNMRRKAEILKYSGVKTNTKTNNLTKSERWAQLVKGSIQQPSQDFIRSNTISQTATAITIQTCPTGTIINTPSYASNIPGPVTQLYLDPNVPLYNYATSQESYSILNSGINNSEFTYESGLNQLDNQLTVNSGSKIATSIYIQNPTSVFRDFSIQFPISIFINGTVSSSTITNTESYNQPITVYLNNIIPTKIPVYCTVQYGYSSVQNIAYDIDINEQVTSVTFDISMVPKINDPLNNYFSGNQYLGICTINNFRILGNNGNTIQQGLTTQPGLIYDIFLNTLDSNEIPLYDISGISDTGIINNNYTTYFNTPSYGIYVNVSRNTANQTVNCSVKNPNSFPSISTIFPLIIT
jgi:hypothetical protein